MPKEKKVPVEKTEAIPDFIEGGFIPTTESIITVPISENIGVVNTQSDSFIEDENDERQAVGFSDDFMIKEGILSTETLPLQTKETPPVEEPEEIQREKRFISIGTFAKKSGQKYAGLYSLIDSGKIILNEFPSIEGEFIDTERFNPSDFVPKSYNKK